MTKIKADVIAINTRLMQHQRVTRRMPPRPKSVPVQLAGEYRAIVRQLIAMPDWCDSRLPLVEALMLAIAVMRSGDPAQSLPASNAVLRYSKALGLVPQNPRLVPARRPSSKGKQEEASPSSNRAPWSRD